MKCSHIRSDCIDSRPQDGYTRRRYQCKICKVRFTTMEVQVETENKKGVPMLKLLSQQYGNPIDVEALGKTIKSLSLLKSHLER